MSSHNDESAEREDAWRRLAVQITMNELAKLNIHPGSEVPYDVVIYVALCILASARQTTTQLEDVIQRLYRNLYFVSPN